MSLDLLYDVPGQTLASWTETLEHALSLEPDHVSAYALTLDDPDAEGLTGPSGDHLPTTPGARRWRESARAAQDEDRAAGAYGLADALLEANGYAWYELSNWARPGHQSRHNLAYWERRPYAAVGPGAHSFDGATRRWNAAPLEAWMASLAPRSAGARPGAAARRHGGADRGGRGRPRACSSASGWPAASRATPRWAGSTSSPGRPSTAWSRMPRESGSASRFAAGCSPTSCSPASSDRHAELGRERRPLGRVEPRSRCRPTAPRRLTPAWPCCYDPTTRLALYR